MSIIHREPVLFSGTIRRTLDPFDDHPDHVLWNALDEVHSYIIIKLIIKLLLMNTFRSPAIRYKLYIIIINYCLGKT